MTLHVEDGELYFVGPHFQGNEAQAVSQLHWEEFAEFCRRHGEDIDHVASISLDREAALRDRQAR